MSVHYRYAEPQDYAALKLTDKTVPIAEQPKKLISAEFQMVDGLGSVLVVRNHFDRTLRYRALIKTPNRQPEPTTVCAIRANLRAIEQWPYRIAMIAFGDFAPLKAGEAEDCRWEIRGLSRVRSQFS